MSLKGRTERFRISPLAIRLGAAILLAAPAAQAAAAAPSVYFEFRDEFRPDSEEAAKHEYTPIAWGDKERELVRSRLDALAGKAEGLLQRAGADGALSLYLADLSGGSQAKGGYRRLAVSGRALPSPGYDWLTRILAHELVHSADPYGRLCSDLEWNALIEPRITAARTLLEKKGLTVVAAATLAIGPERMQVEKEIRDASGLPSAYSAHSTEETLAEIVSFMLDGDTGYTPPPEIAAFLRKRLLEPASNAKDPAGAAYREGLRLTAAGKNSEAGAAYSAAIRLAPKFVLPYIERAKCLKASNAKAAANLDFLRAIALSPRYSRFMPYLLSERDATK